LIPLVLEELKKRGIEPNKDVLVLVGGIIPKDDAEKLLKMGVSMIFGPGTRLSEIVDFIKKEVEKLRDDL